MPSFPVQTLDSAPVQIKPLLEQTKKNFGFIPNLIGVMANSPAITEAYLTIADIFTKSSLTATEQQIVLLTVSHFHQCTYCVAAHTAIAGMKNIEPTIVNAIRDNQAITDPKLQALRQFTNSLIKHRGWAEEQEIKDFLSAGYTESQILDIMVGVAQKTLSNFTNHMANTPLDSVFAEVAWSPTNITNDK